MRLWSGLQRFRLGRLIVALVLAVVLLQLVHMMLLNRLEAREGSAGSLRTLAGGEAPADAEVPGGGVGGRQLQGRTVSHVVAEMSERVSNSYRLDKSGTYHIIDNFLTSEHVVLESDHDVTVVTQCSARHLHHLVALSERWKGPISVAVFTYDEDFVAALRNILYFHFCSDSVFRYVTFHLAFPISRTPQDVAAAARAAEAWLSSSSCAPLLPARPQAPPAEVEGAAAHDEGQGAAAAAAGKNYAVRGLEYPHNMLRNLAINYVQTRYVLVADVDMLPSQDLRPQFHRLLARLELDNRSSSSLASSSSWSLSPASSLSSSSSSSSSVLPLSKRAFVVPSFELKEGEAVPATKTQLLAAWARGVARPFYSQLCAKCQRPTDYPRWKDAPGSPYGDLRIAYSVRWVDPWEPFYIAAASVPLYDERFKQYGFNRISQVCEMHVAGYQFDVLDNAFVVHQGFKSRHGFHATKEQEQNANRQLFRKFKGELETKYPQSPRRC